MKKIILSFGFALCTLVIYAQEEESTATFSRGVLTVGGLMNGNLVFNKSLVENKNDVYWSLGINPSIGKFVSEKVMIGTGLSLLYFREKSFYPDAFAQGKFSEETSRNVSIGLSLGMRYYFHGNLFLHGGGDLSRTYLKDILQNDRESISSYTNLHVSGGIGYTWFLKSFIAIEPVLSYSSLRVSTLSAHNVSLAVGFRYFLNRE